MKAWTKNAALFAAAGALFVALPSWGAGQYRVQSTVSASAYGYGTTEITDPAGNSVFSSSGYTYADSDSAITFDAATIGFARDFRQFGDAFGTTSAFWSASAKTTFGGNHVAVEMIGAASSAHINFSATDPVSGNSVNVTADPSRYVYADSTWEELFLITARNPAASGSGGTMNVRIHLSGSMDGNEGNYWYELSNFDRSNVVFSFVSTREQTGSFGYDLVGSYDFEYGEPLYLKSRLYAQLSDAGFIDLSHSATVTGIELPTGSAVRFLSGAPMNAYGGIAGADGYGEYGGGGGGGGGVVPVPEAESYAMMLAGLVTIGAMIRRRRHST